MKLRPKIHVGWFRFSLRAMFEAVTVFGLWLGWQVSIVRQRKQLLINWELNPRGVGAVVFHAGDRPLSSDNAIEVSWIRRLLGDRTVGSIFLLGASDEDEEQAKKAFPESEVVINPSTPPIQ
jgi:hypothetical protein